MQQLQALQALQAIQRQEPALLKKGKVVTSTNTSTIPVKVYKPPEAEANSEEQDKVVPWHLKAALSRSGAVLEPPRGIARVVATEQPTEEPAPVLVASEFDQAGKLVLTYNNGEKLVSKNNAPADMVQHTVVAPLLLVL